MQGVRWILIPVLGIAVVLAVGANRDEAQEERADAPDDIEARLERVERLIGEPRYEGRSLQELEHLYLQIEDRVNQLEDQMRRLDTNLQVWDRRR